MKFVALNFLLLLLLVRYADGSGDEQLKNVLRLHSMDHDRRIEDGGSVKTRLDSSSHMDQSVMVFFTLKDLKAGNSMPIYFRKKDSSTSPRFLPRNEADAIAFSLTELPALLRFFSFSPGSPQAKAMEATLRECEIPAIKGEVKICATSIESMLVFASGILGSNSDFKILATEHHTKSNTLFQNYTILKAPDEIPAPRIVACHTMPYPYAVLYCHSQETENRVFRVSLGGENGDRVTAVAVCHMDTSQWTRDHVSFRVLGIEPGSPGVCHFFPADNFVLVPDS
ncbi:unknown seed protein like 1 [Hibiscus trionum]|uniref:BURP domain-containing protein n=1 Tax=Hibiscus trionum TaxID=183268 RepID=A0A9W7J2L9_HIBTR|nr:unknown seed protein like 1 [Hibiscus trionum]